MMCHVMMMNGYKFGQVQMGKSFRLVLCVLITSRTMGFFYILVDNHTK